MKKSLISSSVLFGLFTVSSGLAGGPEVLVPAEPNYFNGFFVGGTGAFHQAAFDGSSTVTSPVDINIQGTTAADSPFIYTVFEAGNIISTSVDGNAFGGFGGVQGGIGKVFSHRWYLGVMGFGEWGSESDTSNSSTPVNKNLFIESTADAQIDGMYTSSTTIKISNDYGVAGKLGYLVAPRTMAYVKIGAVWANIKVSNNVTVNGSITDTVQNVLFFFTNGTASGSSSNEETKSALLLGAGFEQFIYKDILTINAEYNYANFGTVNTDSVNLVLNGQTTSASGVSNDIINQPSPATTQASANAKVSTFLVGLNAYFGQNWL